MVLLLGGLVEREVLLTGIGGQGVQLAARTLAVAATASGREVMVFGRYGGAMRGGNTDSTVVVADHAVRTPPTVVSAWYGLAMHHAYWGEIARRLRPGGLAVIDSGVFQGDPGREDVHIVAVDASGTASDLGAPLAGSMVALGALAAATALVEIDALVDATAHVLPPYRASHAEANARAIVAGAALVAEPVTDAWSGGPLAVLG
jgi:Pyruvate/2-oxoacid:ferredoxin oxidoreductase gamma subunit